jgi:hypothetical protein
VIVTWRDAFFEFEQKTAELPREDYLVRTAGFLIHDGDSFISLAQEILPDGDGYRGVTHIPRRMVVATEDIDE